MDNYSELLKKEGENYQDLVKHILYAKTFDPKFSEEAELMINQYFENVMSPEDSEASNRLWETLRNLCYAVARLKLKDTVDVKDAKEVIEFYNKQLEYWSQIADIPPDIRDLAKQEMVKKLTGQKFATEFIELLKAVCEDTMVVDQYVKKSDKEDKRDWNVRSNKKIRDIHDKFTKEPMDERIMILSFHPLTLAWRETGGDKEVSNLDGDPGDPGDLEKSEPEKISKESNETDVNTKQEIFNKDVIPGVTKVTKVTKSSEQEFFNESSKVDPTEPEDSPSASQTSQSVEYFFSNDMPLPGHSLEQSPCYPIIGSMQDEMQLETIYYCKLHPDLGSTFLTEIELHCREKEPEIHRAEISRVLGLESGRRDS
jgi:hypothetical protein